MEPTANILIKLVEWIWVPMAIGIVRLWQKLSGQETKMALIEQSQEYCDKRSEAESAARETIKTELSDRLNEHHTAVMDRMDRIDRAIKNGR